ncbi:hypothetical protein [Streptomyces sp. NPDC047014]|uniref:hypothetical protein n=1 Tax=Streptomyces sp. NPDC047014 TaxID=3155736 RepID=UPI003410D037
MTDFTAQMVSVRGEVARLCLGFQALPLGRRLSAIAELRSELDEATGQALEVSMAAARHEGWGLRRIGKAAHLSHETVRGRLAHLHPGTGRCT